MAHEDAAADLTAVTNRPANARKAATHGITLEWQNPAVARPSPLAHVRAAGARPLIIAIAVLASALVATGALMWNSASSNSGHVSPFTDDMPAFAARATPRDIAPPAPVLAPQTAVAGIIAPDVAPAWTVIQAAIEPTTGATARQVEHDILAATAAMPTGSLAPATDAGGELGDQPPVPVSRNPTAIRRATGLDSANKARERTRNTKWTGTFFDQ